jgi:T5SS/PEP-CTERM-associated repeat protein
MTGDDYGIRAAQSSTVRACLAVASARRQVAALVNRSAGGTYGASGNWTPSGPPSSPDNANFTNNATYTVTWGASASAANAAFGAPGGAVTLDTTANYAWTLSGGLNLANTMTLVTKRGTLNTAGDSTLNYPTDFIIGNSTAASGNTFTWNITGGTTKFLSAGAASESANALYIGNSSSPGGRGILNISGASTVVNNDNWLHIGRGNAGSGNQLRITGGAKLNTGGYSYIGWQGGLGAAVMDGAGSVWTVGGVVVGRNGTGNSLIVTNGGKLVSGVSVGESSSNQAIITGPGSTVTGTTCSVGYWYGSTGNNLTVEKGATAWFSGNVANTFFGRDAGSGNPASQSNSIIVTGRAARSPSRARGRMSEAPTRVSGSGTAARPTSGRFWATARWVGWAPCSRWPTPGRCSRSIRGSRTTWR